MTLLLSEEEKKYIVIDNGKEYAFSISDVAPKNIRESLKRKLNAHRKWIESRGVK